MSCLALSAPLALFGRNLSWVPTATHLGHELHESGTMDYDTRFKRAQFIGNSLDVTETFKFASLPQILTAVKVYTEQLEDI